MAVKTGYGLVFLFSWSVGGLAQKLWSNCCLGIHDASRRLSQHGSINRYFIFFGEYLGFFRAGSCAFCGDDLGLRRGVQVRANVGDLCPAQEALQQYRQNSLRVAQFRSRGTCSFWRYPAFASALSKYYSQVTGDLPFMAAACIVSS